MSDVGKLVFTAATILGLAWLVRFSWGSSLGWIDQRGQALSLPDWQRHLWRGVTWLVGPFNRVLFNLFVTQEGNQPQRKSWNEGKTGGYNQPTNPGDDRTMPPETGMCLTVIKTAGKGLEVGTSYPLKAGIHTVGRRPTREPGVELIAIEADQAISRNHLYLEIQHDGTFQVEDRGSAYGTWLNDQRLTSGEKAAVKSGDKLRLGNTTLQLAGADARQPVETNAVAPAWRLVVVNGPEAGQTRQVGQQPLVIGRHPDCDWQLNDNRISRQHAEVRPEGSRVRIADRHSTHGLYVNGHKYESRTLEADDIISLGNIEIRFEKVTD